MFGSTALEIAIGLSFVYALLSLVCSAITEFASRLLALRANTLQESIGRLLTETDREQLYNHPLIRGLESKPHLLRRIADKLRSQSHEGRPAYIPSRLFARALLDIAVHSKGGSGTWPSDVPGLLSALGSTGLEDKTTKALRSIVQASGTQYDLEEAIQSIEDWFDDAMDRASGWYTRQARAILFVVALLVSTAYNADSLTLVHELSVDSTLRQMVVEDAAEFVKAHGDEEVGDQSTQNASVAQTTPDDDAEPPSTAASAEPDVSLPELNDQLGALALPLGWCAVAGGAGAGPTGKSPIYGLVPWCDDPGTPSAAPSDAAGWLLKVEGLLITALALTLGATFWFDMLKELISLRDHGKVPPRANEEE